MVFCKICQKEELWIALSKKVFFVKLMSKNSISGSLSSSQPGGPPSWLNPLDFGALLKKTVINLFRAVLRVINDAESKERKNLFL